MTEVLAPLVLLCSYLLVNPALAYHMSLMLILENEECVFLYSEGIYCFQGIFKSVLLYVVWEISKYIVRVGHHQEAEKL